MAAIRIQYAGTGRKPTYKLNDLAFWNAEANPEAAYWLGFLMADGHIATGKCKSKALCCALSIEDRHHLVALRRFLGSNAPIKDYPGKTAKSAEGGPRLRVTSGPISKLAIYSTALCEYVAQYGLVPRKSLTARVVGLQSSRDFWRGYVDGNGSVFFDGKGNPHLDASGSGAIIHQFREWGLKFAPGMTATVKQVGKISSFRTEGTYAVAIVKELYQPNDIALPRKAVIACKMTSWTRINNDWRAFGLEQLETLIAECGGSNKDAAARLGVSPGIIGTALYRLRKQAAR
jgi:hypothetical protein